MNQQVDNEIGGYVAAENKHAARALDTWLSFLGEIAVLLDRWDGVERRGINAPTGQPRPQAERRVREDRRKV